MTLTTRRLPLVVALCVLLSGLLLVVTRPGAAAPRPTTPDGGMRVLSASGSFVVGPRWTATSDSALLYYADDAGRPVVGLSGAVVADAGYCAGLPTSTRGFAGFADLTGRAGGVETSTRSVAAAWAGGVSGRAPADVSLVPARLGDGTRAVRATARLRTRPSGDPCLAHRVVLDVIGLRGALGPVVLVVVRDVDPLGVTDAEVEAVVQSLRRRT